MPWSMPSHGNTINIFAFLKHKKEKPIKNKNEKQTSCLFIDTSVIGRNDKYFEKQR